MRVLFLLVVAVFLDGCGNQPRRQESESPQAANPRADKSKPAAAARDPRPVIVAFGDSLTAGYGVDEGKSYPAFLQQSLDQSGYRYRVVNEGLSGDTTSGGVERLPGVLARKPAMVILELGANDGLRGLPLSTTRENLETMIEALKKSGAAVVLAGMTLPRNYGPDYIRSFEAIYNDLAKEHRLALIPFLLAGVADSPDLMQRDRLHPTVEGNRRVAATVMTTIRPLLAISGPAPR